MIILYINKDLCRNSFLLLVLSHELWACRLTIITKKKWRDHEIFITKLNSHVILSGVVKFLNHKSLQLYSRTCIMIMTLSEQHDYVS